MKSELKPFDRDMVAMIRRYKRVVSAARLYLLADTFAPHRKKEAKQKLLRAFESIGGSR